MHVHSYTLRHLHPQPHCDSTHSSTHMSTDSWTVTPCTRTALHSPTDPHGDTLITDTRTLTHLQRKLLSGSPQHHDFPHSQSPSQIQASIPAGQGLGGHWLASRGPGRDSTSAECVVPNPSLGSGTPASRPRVRSGAVAEAQPLPPSRGPSPGRQIPRAWAAPGLQPGRAWGALQRARQARPVPTPPSCLPGPVGLRPGLHGAGGPGRGRYDCGREYGLRDPALRSPQPRARAGCGAPSER